MWKTWEVRNKEVHDSSFDAPDDIVQWCAAYLDHYQGAQIPPSLVALSRGASEWHAPPLWTVKVNVDAGLPRDSTNACVAMVARNYVGLCIWWSKNLIIGRPSPTDGEAIAILHGLNVARTKVWSNLVLKSDFLQLVNLLSSRSCSLASFGAIVDRA